MTSTLRNCASTLLLSAASAGLLLAPAAQAAENEWTFGIGTGISLLDLDGDVGFATENGGVIAELDLDNGDTADMVESAFGFFSFANKGPWTIHLMYATVTLEDSDAGFDAEWDKADAQLAVEYAFAKTGNHTWGVLAGVNYIDHEWELQDKIDRIKYEPEDDWTDAVVGLTHNVPFAGNWAWSNGINYSFGDSEGSLDVSTSLNWKPLEHWVFSGFLRYEDIEFGDEGDIGKSDFYYYDVEEISTGIGFAYTW